MDIPVFVDFGGTLGDSIEITRKVFKQVFDKDLTKKQIKQFFLDTKKHNRQSMYLFFKYPINPIKLLLKKKQIRKKQRELFEKYITLYPDIKKTFEKIKEIEGIVLILVTRNPIFEDKTLGKKILNSLFGENPFEYMLSAEDKFDKISKHFPIEQIQKGVFIGDSPDDAYVADLLNIPFYGVSWGYNPPSELKTPFIAYEPLDLYNMVIDHKKDIEESLSLYSKDEVDEVDFEFDEEFDKE